MSRISGFGIALLKRAMDYSNRSYGGEEAFPGYNFLAFSTNNYKFHPNYFVFEEDDDLWVVIRGSHTDDDWSTDFEFDEINLNIGTSSIKAHSGFYRSALLIFNEIKTKISDYSGRIYITGHSLGGSVATILSLLIMSDGDTESLNVYCLAFAPAPSVSFIPRNYKNKIASIVNSEDIVPTLSIPSTHKLIAKFIPESGVPKDYLKPALKITLKILTESNELFSLALYKAAMRSINHIVDVLAEYHKNPSSLSIKTLQGYIYKLEPSTLKLKQALVSPHVFNTLSITSTSLQSHLQENYINIINQATD